MRIANLILITGSLSINSLVLAQTETETTAPAQATESSAPAATSSAASTAGGYSCSMNNLTRSVSVAYENAGAKVPCKVNYNKESEAPGATQVLFSAAAEEGYCEKKMEEFVEKLKGNGWTCNAQ
jgi:hypothetical protein